MGTSGYTRVVYVHNGGYPGVVHVHNGGYPGVGVIPQAIPGCGSYTSGYTRVGERVRVKVSNPGMVKE